MNKKQKKQNIILMIMGLLLIGLAISQIIKNKNEPLYEGKPFVTITEEAIYDYNSKENAVGASDYVFVGKVNNILRTEHTKTTNSNNKVSYDSYTVYSVKVVNNIKRKLITDYNIEVQVAGGLERNGKAYRLVNDLKLLNEGEYYIFLPYLEEDNLPLTINHKELVISLGESYNIKDKNEIVAEYVAAYKNEVVPNSAEYIWPKTPYTSMYDADIKKKH